ncbi:hypothetical protein GNI_024330 [Gregarina niphandrodes]|uniref:Uncharacterized protein n=1 Tax=Gregarina niphandrodes TaxID=110365 RepID=A0A023BBN4_GRENI|nr:hypothetical protein GNI_024330 [Gregarina niphandrodes]EZG79726.1 hypothetical protein GNI_024330 [Gregarina niphandrodes]|eukprot:XP_011134382.1 hypothetical protein GNI_024330 [Gregarina niphandrodes]
MDNALVTYDCLLQGIQKRVTALDWSYGGVQLLSACENDSVFIYGREFKAGPWSVRALYSRKHGAEQTRFVGSSHKLALALSSFDRSTTSSVGRIWDLNQNRFLVEYDFGAKVLRGNGIAHHGSSNLFLANLLNGSVALHTADYSRPLAVFTTTEPMTTFSPSYPSGPIGGLSKTGEGSVGSGVGGGVGSGIATGITTGITTGIATGDNLYRNFFPVSSFDPTSTTIAIATDPKTIKLLDTRHLTQGPYAILPISPRAGATEREGLGGFVRSLDFTPLSGHLLVTTSEGRLFTMEPCSGAILTEFTPRNSRLVCSQPRPESACAASIAHSACGFGYPQISPDESLIACGLYDSDCDHGIVQLWCNRSGGGNVDAKPLSDRDLRDRERDRDLRDRDPRDRDPRDLRDVRDPRDLRDARDARDTRDRNDARGLRDPRDRDFRDLRDPARDRDRDDPRERQLAFGRFPDLPYFLAFNPTMSEIAVGDITTTSWVIEPRKESVKDSTSPPPREKREVMERVPSGECPPPPPREKRPEDEGPGWAPGRPRKPPPSARDPGRRLGTAAGQPYR